MTRLTNRIRMLEQSRQVILSIAKRRSEALKTATATCNELAALNEAQAKDIAELKHVRDALRKKVKDLEFCINEIQGEIGWDDELEEELKAKEMDWLTYVRQWIRNAKK